jgi:hypothetical protein
MLLRHSVGVRLVNARYLFCYLVHHIPDHILGKDLVPVIISLLEYKSVIKNVNLSELTFRANDVLPRSVIHEWF